MLTSMQSKTINLVALRHHVVGIPINSVHIDEQQSETFRKRHNTASNKFNLINSIEYRRFSYGARSAIPDTFDHLHLIIIHSIIKIAVTPEAA